MPLVKDVGIFQGIHHCIIWRQYTVGASGGEFTGRAVICLYSGHTGIPGDAHRSSLPPGYSMETHD